MKREIQSQLAQLAKFLTKKSKEICRDNQCTEDNHNCESNAYIDITIDKDDNILSIDVIDICLSDYMQRSTNSMISLPFSGSGKDLAEMLISEYQE
jgi:hypothetical protein